MLDNIYMVVVKYSVFKTIFITDSQLDEYSKFIKDTLQDKRGWSKPPYNYEFIPVPNEEKNTVKILFLDNDSIKKIDKGLDNLSGYDPSTHSIYINLKNWNNGGWGGIFPKTNNEDGLTRYRQYVINHEFGHSLGLNHPDAKSKGPVSIMEQGTKGLLWLNRKVEKSSDWRNYNSWPLESNIYNEEAGDGGNKLLFKIYGGLYKKRCWILYIFLLFIIIIVLVLIVNTSPLNHPFSLPHFSK